MILGVKNFEDGKIFASGQTIEFEVENNMEE